MTPWPLSEKLLPRLAIPTAPQQTDPTGYGIYLIDVFGTKELLYRDPAISCFTPIPLRPRPRPPVLPDVTDPADGYAVCALSATSAAACRASRRAGSATSASRRASSGPTANKYGGQRYEPDAKGTEINWTPARVIGTVPVEADGSAHFRVPADTAVYFQLLDENQMELRRMRSFISFQPGEQRAASAATRREAVAPRRRAVSRWPCSASRSMPVPPPWGTGADQLPARRAAGLRPALRRAATAG